MRMQRWQATSYRRVIATYRAAGAGRGRPAPADRRPGRDTRR